ncbi:MAG: M15 family metallopeptidase [Thermodesulfobacteriota bacterium]
MKPLRYACLFQMIAVVILLARTAWAEQLPEGFVYLDQVVPEIRVELRYHTRENFVGNRIEGYVAPRCIMTRQTAEALQGVQKDLSAFGLGLKIYDAYRPQRAVDHFVRWGRDLQDTRMKSKYYPDVEKKNLFTEGYIADRSSHSRGGAVDLTIVWIDPDGTAKELDMGTGFDLFSRRSWPQDLTITPAQRAHRMLLQALMTKHGFESYPQEWWHFKLRDEPFPDTYFDFLVQ